jgi:hypothetical protein
MEEEVMGPFGSRPVVAPLGLGPAEAEGGKKSSELQTPKTYLARWQGSRISPTSFLIRSKGQFCDLMI